MATRKAKVEAQWDEETEKEVKNKVGKWMKECGKNNVNSGGGAVYGLGFIGALVYFLSTATNFWDGVWGVIQAILWPGFVVFEILKFFNL